MCCGAAGAVRSQGISLAARLLAVPLSTPPRRQLVRQPANACATCDVGGHTPCLRDHGRHRAPRARSGQAAPRQRRQLRQHQQQERRGHGSARVVGLCKSKGHGGAKREKLGNRGTDRAQGRRKAAAASALRTAASKVRRTSPQRAACSAPPPLRAQHSTVPHKGTPAGRHAHATLTAPAQEHATGAFACSCPIRLGCAGVGRACGVP